MGGVQRVRVLAGGDVACQVNQVARQPTHAGWGGGGSVVGMWWAALQHSMHCHGLQLPHDLLIHTSSSQGSDSN
jgi:hypothetical protein